MRTEVISDSRPSTTLQRPGAETTSYPCAIIIGLDTITGLQTARVLKRHAVPIRAIATEPGHYFCRTNVCERIYAADTSGEELIELLLARSSEMGNDAVLFPCTDNSVLLVSRYRDALSESYRFSLPDAEVVDMLMDKARFSAFARETGLPVPTTCLLRDDNDVERAAAELRFPCVLKPSLKTAHWNKHSRFKVQKINNPQELRAAYRECSRWSELLVVQEWIAGTDADLFTANGYFDSQSQPLAMFTSRKIRQWPPESGTASLCEACHDGTVLETCIRLFQAAGFRGLGELEMKRDRRTGQYLITEPNVGRPTAISPLAEEGGVDLHFLAYCDAAGIALPTDLTQTDHRVKWIYFRRDLASAFHYWRQGELTASEWCRSVQGRKKDAVASWRDPAPFWGDLWDAFKRSWKRPLRESR